MSISFAPKRPERKQLYVIGAFVAAMWLVYFIDVFTPLTATDWGLRPRSFSGLLGIPLMPFLHSGLGHVFGNTIPLIVLMLLLYGSRANHWLIVAGIVLINGVLLWLFGRNAVHVGASGLVFGLISFLIVSGIFEKRPIPIAISLFVGVMYGGTLIGGLMPLWNDSMSWDGHLCGVVAGVVMAYIATKRAPNS